MNSPANTLHITWCEDKEYLETLVAFFVENVDTSYISHGEVQSGRASDFSRWSEDLPDVLREEFDWCLESHAKNSEWRLATAMLNNELVSIMVVRLYRAQDVRPYAILDDIVVKKTKRDAGIGHAMLQWLERALPAEGMSSLFLESGIRNQRAHSFFERQGYSVCSKIMYKTLL